MYEKLTGVRAAVLAADFVSFARPVVVCVSLDADDISFVVDFLNDTNVAEVEHHNRVFLGRGGDWQEVFLCPAFKKPYGRDSWRLDACDLVFLQKLLSPKRHGGSAPRVSPCIAVNFKVVCFEKLFKIRPVVGAYRQLFKPNVNSRDACNTLWHGVFLLCLPSAVNPQTACFY